MCSTNQEGEEEERGGAEGDMHLEEPNRGRRGSSSCCRRRRCHCLTNPSEEKRDAEVEVEVEMEMKGGREGGRERGGGGGGAPVRCGPACRRRREVEVAAASPLAMFDLLF
jgi:hypothetical protein